MKVPAFNNDFIYIAIMVELLFDFKERLKNRKIRNIIINNNKLSSQDRIVLFYKIGNNLI